MAFVSESTVSSSMTMPAGATLHRILSDGLDSPTINQYTSAGFIVWYCFVVMCCGVPLICLFMWYCCKRCRANELPLDGDDAFMMGVNENLDIEISRIEANVNAFSEIEKNRKKIKLLKAFKKHTETVTKEQEQNPVHEEQPVAAINKNDKKTNKEENTFQSQLTMGCQICLGQYEENDKVIQSSTAACKHMFHEQCILEWLSTPEASGCPCCRQPFVEDGGTLEALPMSVNSDQTSSPSVSSLDGNDESSPSSPAGDETSPSSPTGDEENP